MTCRFWVNNFYNSFDINKNLHCLHRLATEFFIDSLKEELQANSKPLSTSLFRSSKSQHCLMAVVATSCRQGALVTNNLYQGVQEQWNFSAYITVAHYVYTNDLSRTRTCDPRIKSPMLLPN